MSLLRIFFLFVVIGAGILFLIRKLSVSQFLAPFITITGITTALYIFALFNFLKQGLIITTVALLILGILSFLNWPFKKPLEKLRISPPLIAWIIAFLIIVVYTTGTFFYKWDEFSYWGVIYRYLMSTNHLPGLAGNFLVTNYPPFTAIFQYFVGTIVKNAESSAYFAHILLAFSAIIAILPNKMWQGWKKYSAILLLCILSVFPMDLRFQSLYVDLMLGLLFAVGLTSSVFNNNLSTERAITVGLASVALILTKPLGLLFTVVYIGILYFDVLLRNYKIASIKDFFTCFLKPIGKPKILLILSLILLAFISWSIHSRQFNNTNIHLSFNSNPVSSSDIYPGDPDYYLSNLEKQEVIYNKSVNYLNQPVQIDISLVDTLRIFTVNIPYRTKLIIQNFIANISENSFGTVKISTLTALLIILGTALLSHFTIPLMKRKESSSFQINIILFIGFVIYSFALLFAYIYYFPPAAGIAAPSVNRYLSSYLLGWWLLIICMLYQQESFEIPIIKIQTSSIITFVLIFTLALFVPLSTYFHSPNSIDPQRLEVNRIYKAIGGRFTSEDKVYDIWQVDNSSGLNFFMMKYYLTPIASNNFGWRLTENKNAEIKDATIIEIDANEWLKSLNDQNYTYVMVSSSDELFWNEYGMLFDTFENKNTPQLFSVTPTGLIKVPIQIKY